MSNWRDCPRCREQYPAGDYKRHKRTEDHRAGLAAGPMAARDAEIAAALADPAVTYQSVADRYGITRQRVHQIGVRAGVVTNDRRKNPNAAYLWRTCAKCGVTYRVREAKQHRQTEEHRTSFDKRANLPKIMRMVELYQEGWATQAIVEIMAEEGWGSVFQESVYRHLRRFGVEPNRGAGHYARYENGLRLAEQPWAKKVAELYASGVPPSEIVLQVPELAAYRVPHNTITRIRAEFGIPAQNTALSEAQRAIQSRKRAERAENAG